MKQGLMLRVGLALGALVATARAETKWTWSGNNVDQIGQCTATTCTFTLTETSGTGASLSGTFTRPTGAIAGFMDLLVTSSTPSSGGWDVGTITNNVTHLYAVDIPGVLRVVQPLIAEDRSNPVIFSQPTCPTVPAGGLLFNWGWGHWDPHAGVDNVTSAGQVVGGTLAISSQNAITVPTNFAMTPTSWVTGPLPASLALASAPGPTCGSTTAGAWTLSGTGDRGGTLYYAGKNNGSGVIVYKTSSGHTVLGASQTTIASLAQISGPYVGFAYDTLQTPGLNGSASTQMVKLNVTTTGCTTATDCVGTPIDSSGIATTYMNGALNLQVVSLNTVAGTSVPGMFEGTLYDGATPTPNSGETTCELIYNFPSASATPPDHNVIFCQAQKPGATATAYNLLLTSVPQASGGLDTTSGLNGANGTTGTGGNAGFVVAHAGGSASTPAYGLGIAEQTDGKLVVVGDNDPTGTSASLSVGRYNPDGSFDSSWNAGALTSLNPGGQNNQPSHALGLALDTNGQAVVVGNTTLKTGGSRYLGATVVRLTTAGAADSTFTQVKADLSSGTTKSGSTFNAVALQTDGKIVAAGYGLNSSGKADLLVARYGTSGGSIDSAWNSGAALYKTPVSSNNNYVNAVALDSSGNVVVAATCGDPTNTSRYASTTETGGTKLCVCRATSAGAWDSTFGTSGCAVLSVGTYSAVMTNAVALDTSGNIYVAGSAYNGSRNQFLLARFTSAGALDTSFNTAGYVVTDVAGDGVSASAAYALLIQGNGKIVLGGNTGGWANLALARFNSVGTLDTTFGVGGVLATNPASSGSILGMAFDSIARLLFVGADNYVVSSSTSYNFIFGRYWP